MLRATTAPSRIRATGGFSLVVQIKRLVPHRRCLERGGFSARAAIRRAHGRVWLLIQKRGRPWGGPANHQCISSSDGRPTLGVAITGEPKARES
jgi:hypothetical protein